ncbi:MULTISPECIES: hypothetical protein [unclassified Aurantimonas]|uniref:hypothetical protein n=1 Tax=unclassified Aurantimonas TaxID=2638230 RepID=UPI002E181CFE|nr:MULTISPECIES: hypothetical protein [unclassified Aurantimonas]MEC5292806.1 hypothetical protein [Aurantimonas sp. C2-3-R2]MEC5413858.1 hypothetical protein [Aurantimonas sp. C2-4-R8]
MRMFNSMTERSIIEAIVRQDLLLGPWDDASSGLPSAELVARLHKRALREVLSLAGRALRVESLETRPIESDVQCNRLQFAGRIRCKVRVDRDGALLIIDLRFFDDADTASPAIQIKDLLEIV